MYIEKLQVPVSETIIKQPKKRVSQQIKDILGKSRHIDSPEKAKAILAIPQSDVVWSDDKTELPMIKREAMDYLEYGDWNFWVGIGELYESFVKSSSGKTVLGYLSAIKSNIANILPENTPNAQPSTAFLNQSPRERGGAGVNKALGQ